MAGSTYVISTGTKTGMLTRSCAASTNLRSPVSVGKLRLAGQLLSHQRTDDPGVFHESVAPALSTRPRALGLVAESFGRRLAIDDDCAARATLMDRRQDRQALCVTLLVRIKSVDEDARVDGVSALIASHLP